MAAINDIDIDVISLLVLAFIFANTTKRAEHAFTQHRLFIMLIAVLSFLLVFDGISRIADGLPGLTAYYINWASNMLLFIGVPLVPGLWALYADFQVYHDEERLKRYARPLWIYFIVNGIISLSGLFTGWFFTIVPGNIYQRGPLFLLHPLGCYIAMLCTFIFIVRNRKRIDGKHFTVMLLFIVPSFIGGILQSMFYGLATILSCITLSVLMLHFNLQDKRLDTDYLTGVFNRRLLDSYLGEKAARGRPFSALLIDLDGFKAINDTHGHVAGDNALLDAVKVLRCCLREGDFIARYGGDEFLVALDIVSEEVLEDTVLRTRKCLEEFNQSNGRPYRLSFSMGRAVYHSKDGPEARTFLKRLDGLLYEDKKRTGAVGPAAERPAGATIC